MSTFKSILISEANGKYTPELVQRNIDDLPQGDVLVNVQYSSLNYKDALSSMGNKGVTRNFPHQPGIDAAGVVVSSNVAGFAKGDEVIVTGYDLGMNTAGGLAEYIRVPGNWLVKIPRDLSTKQSMQIGTAGLTAFLCINKLERAGLTADAGSVLVNGASGGVGLLAINMLAAKGYKVTACTGKPEFTDVLQAMGASEVISRDGFAPNKRPLLNPIYAAAIDVAGGNTLAELLKQIQPGGSVACCGLADSADLATSVLPFILRGINLLGVDSVDIALSEKQQAWQAIAEMIEQLNIDDCTHSIHLAQVPDKLAGFFSDAILGRYLVEIAAH